MSRSEQTVSRYIFFKCPSTLHVHSRALACETLPFSKKISSPPLYNLIQRSFLLALHQQTSQFSIFLSTIHIQSENIVHKTSSSSIFSLTQGVGLFHSIYFHPYIQIIQQTTFHFIQAQSISFLCFNLSSIFCLLSSFKCYFFFVKYKLFFIKNVLIKCLMILSVHDL